jgi:hypothetical protein
MNGKKNEIRRNARLASPHRAAPPRSASLRHSAPRAATQRNASPHRNATQT